MDKDNPVGTGSFSMGRKAGSLVGNKSHAEGNDTTASGVSSHAEGVYTTASGSQSHAEGKSTTALGNNSHAEGYYTTASGNYSHAEGFSTTALGVNSHAEGNSTNKFSSIVTTTNPTNADIITAWKSNKFSLSKGSSSHVEGKDNLALGNYSHAEGSATIASGNYSHAEGYKTTASGSSQHVQGKFNIDDTTSTYADIIGNGTSDTVDWNGVPWFQGRPQFGGTAQDQNSQTVMANGDKEIILKSSTPDSTKKFKITVDDTGTIFATEVL